MILMMNKLDWSIVRLLAISSFLLSWPAGADALYTGTGTIVMPLGIFGAGSRETALGNTWVGCVECKINSCHLL